MSNSSRFAQQPWNFTKHYSSENGTRQGLFSLFYGIPGNYWDMFLRKRQGSVLPDKAIVYGKLVIPFKSTTQHQNLATDLNDNPIDGTLLASQMKPIIFEALKDARYYSR